MDLFGAASEDDAQMSAVAVPDIPELDRRELMAMEKEITGIYLSGHPMDDYRDALRSLRVTPIGSIVGGSEDASFADDQPVTIAGIVQSVKMKTTRNNSMMAYVTVEDDTASVELLVFASTLDRYGTLLRENAALILDGRVSLRDDKDPQIILRDVRELTEQTIAAGRAAQEAQAENKTLYLRIASETAKEYPIVKAILEMFTGGNTKTVLFFADTRARRGTACKLDANMLAELRALLGEDSVVLK